MYYPDPLTVRMVKQTLKDTAKDCAVIGAASVVEGVMGSLWGHLFTLNNNREYLNFIGELAGRTLSSSTRKFADQVYKNTYAVKDKNGKLVVHIPAETREGILLNDDGSNRGNNHKYDVVGLDTDISGKFKHNFKYVGYKQNNPQKQVQQNNKSNQQKQVIVNNKPALPQPKDHSEHLLMALDEISTRPVDFSFASAFIGVKNKIMRMFGKRPKDDFAKDVLKGCYEYLEESGYDAYPVMVDVLNRRSADFSEKVEEVCKEDLELDLKDFKRSAIMYSKLTDDQKKILSDYLKGMLGEEAATEYLWSVTKYNAVNVPPTKRRLGIFKVLSAIAVALSALAVLLSGRNSRDIKELNKNL